MKYRIIVAAVVAALAAFGATATAHAATPLSEFLDTITCSSPGPVLSGEALEEEDPCEGVTTQNVGQATPICVAGVTYKFLPDQDEDEDTTAADLVSYLNDVYRAGAKVGACGGGVAPAPPVSYFLCYSTFQTVPGVWPKDVALQLLKQGYWLAYAVPGNVSGGTNIGGFHLVCNLAGTQAVNGSFVGGDGTALGSSYNGVDGLYPQIGG